MNLFVEPGHPDAGASLLQVMARALAEMGAEVVIAAGDDNLIRARRADDPGYRPFVVVAAGLPNLVHEFAHAIQARRLADDHGFDYGLIPLDLRVAEQRALLWEELACSVLSCAYAPAGGDVDAWFKEQVEIQGVFYGVSEGAEFAALVDATRAAHPGELPATVEAAYRAVAQALRAVGAADAEAEPPQHLTFEALWARYRRRLPASPLASG
ncbi:hypothetical protein SAMN02745121_00716 [Nannocystis exedens]|uniref:Uncharacterized protein n=1 Tax=Nannocystis exedens TaxID=54 RepID=A0A1I1TRJ1_9BACT|nr:hypothetical protein [Nannocystis exedens]PCC66555.1 hypothetical protein NAEX_09143 [Nannocystis exedens]SFD58100.1 hypothetical protein SAMN02745121_00716 [Nannocystis exedens]